MNNENDTNSIKLKMIDIFYLEVKRIFNEYNNNNFNIAEFKHQINRYFDSWNICRLDIKNNGNANNSVKVTSTEPDVKITYPKWFDNGRGCVVQSEKSLNLDIECVGEGNLILDLKGIDFRNYEQKRIPICINYTTLKYNNSLLLNTNKFAFHDSLKRYSKPCKTNEKIKIIIEFKTIHDYYPDIVKFKNKIKYETNKDTITSLFKKFEEYLLEEKYNLNLSKNQDDSIFEEHANILKKIDALQNELNILKSDFNSHVLSTHDFFSTLYLDCEIKTKGILKLVQDFSQEFLNFIVNVCEKYNLDYWLDYGTLLGATRHGSFVPWDDDIDIGMFRCDIKKFLTVIHEELKNYNLDKYVYVALDRTYQGNLITFIQIFYNCKYLLGSVDIFPYDFIKNPDENLNKTFMDEREQFKNDLKSGKTREHVESNYFKKLNISLEKQEFMIAGVDGVPGPLFLLETKEMFPLDKCLFNKTSYSCPKNIDLYLKKKYGNYKNIPKQIRNHNERIVTLKADKNAYELLETHTKMLKNINQTFKILKNIEDIEKKI